MRSVLLAVILGLILLKTLDAGNFEADVRVRADQRYEEITSLLRQHTIDYEEQELLKEYGAFGKSVLVKISGTAVDTETAFVLAMPLTTLADTGIHPHAGFDFALDFIEAIRIEPAETPIIVAFLADEWQGPQTGTGWAGFAGLLDCIGDIDNPLIIYTDIIEPVKQLDIIQASEIATVPLEFLSSFVDVCENAGIPFNVYSSYHTLYKYNIVQNPPPVRMAAEREIPILYIMAGTGSVFGMDTGIITARRLAYLFADWAAQIPYLLLKEKTGNYFIAEFGKMPVFLPEYIIIILWYVFALYLYISVLLYRQETGRMRRIFFFLSIGSALFFMITAVIDITLIPMALFALFIFPLGFLLYGINKKYKFLSKKTPVKFTLIMTICMFIALIPYTNIVFETVTLIASQKLHPEFMPKADSLYDDHSLLDLSIDTQPLLERIQVNLDIQSKEEALYYRLLLKPQEGYGTAQIDTGQFPLFVYTSPLPYSLTAEGIEFHLGTFPPKTLSLEIALPRELTNELILEAFYDGQRHSVFKTPLE